MKTINLSFNCYSFKFFLFLEDGVAEQTIASVVTLTIADLNLGHDGIALWTGNCLDSKTTIL